MSPLMENSSEYHLPGERETDDWPAADDMTALLDIYQTTAHIVHVYISPILAAIGICSNLVAAVALWKRAKERSTYNYLFGLALVDLLYLVLMAGFWCLYSGPGIDLQRVIECNVVNLLIYVLGQVSGWFLVLCCAERALIVSYPHRAQTLFSPRRARFAMLVTVVLLLIANWNFLGGLKLATSQGPDDFQSVYDVCVGRTPSLRFYLREVYPWVDMLLYAVLPMLLLVVSNGVIVRKYMGSRNKIYPTGSALKTMAKSARKFMFLAGGLSLVPLVCTTPVEVSMIIYRLSSRDVVRYHVLIAGKFFITLSLLNHGVNLWICMILSRSFRADVRKVIGCKCREVVTGQGDASFE